MKPHASVMGYIVVSDSKPARAGGRGSDSWIVLGLTKLVNHFP